MIKCLLLSTYLCTLGYNLNIKCMDKPEEKHKNAIPAPAERPFMQAFSATIHPPVDFVGTNGDSSDDVLIDIDGHGVNFTTGYYDFDAQKWRVHREFIELDESKFVWMLLPLIKYEK